RAFDQGLITSVLAGVGFAGCQFFESTRTLGGTHCFTAVGMDSSGKKVGIVVFRGTDADDPRNIGTDADLIPTPWVRGGEVHRDFAGALNEINGALGIAVKSMGCPVLLTGHSLGAALATLAASFYRPVVANDSALYTFGSPRVGTSGFAATLSG